jgi:uncharacterized protein (DUF169 family)
LYRECKDFSEFRIPGEKGRFYPHILHAEVPGIQSVFSDAVAQTCLSGKPNFSLGCDDSGRFSGIADDERVMGFPAEILPEIVDAVKNYH